MSAHDQATIETGLTTALRAQQANATERLARGGAIVMDDPRRAETPTARAVRLGRELVATLVARKITTSGAADAR